MNKFLVTIVALFLLLIAAFNLLLKPRRIVSQIAKIEKDIGVRIGVYALDTSNNNVIEYRAEENFPFQSTFKVIAVAKLLKQSEANQNLLKKKIKIQEEDILSWAPVTKNNIGKSLTLEDLASAAISHSDNTATNLILRELGGPQEITQFAAYLGNKSFTLKHYEPELKSNPNKEMDVSTPKDMALSLYNLLLGDKLGLDTRSKLLSWLRNSKTGSEKVAAALSDNWMVASKTGSGSYGVSNDLAMVWSTNCKPIILSIYTMQNTEKTQCM